MSGLNECNSQKHDLPIEEYEKPKIGKLYKLNPELSGDRISLEADHPVKWIYLTKDKLYFLVGVEPYSTTNNAGTWTAWLTTLIDGEKVIVGRIPCWVWHYWLKEAVHD